MLGGGRLCRCGHRRAAHVAEWAWTSCVSCRCTQWRWVRAGRFWDRRYRQAHRG